MKILELYISYAHVSNCHNCLYELTYKNRPLPENEQPRVPERKIGESGIVKYTGLLNSPYSGQIVKDQWYHLYLGVRIENHLMKKLPCHQYHWM